jgi:Epoxide hydrolase N terminus
MPSAIETFLHIQISAEGTFADIQRLVARWKVGYDWRQHESRLNEDLSQFKRDIHADGFGALEFTPTRRAKCRMLFRCYSLLGLSKKLEKGV